MNDSALRQLNSSCLPLADVLIIRVYCYVGLGSHSYCALHVTCPLQNLPVIPAA